MRSAVVLAIVLVLPGAAAAEYWAASLPVGFTDRPSTLVLGNMMPGTETVVVEDSAGVLATIPITGGGGATYLLGTQLKGTQIAPNAAMRATTSSSGVVATVYSPADPSKFMNDASRLIKEDELGRDHVVSAWHVHPPTFIHKSWIVVLGTQDGTTVSVTPTSTITAGGTVPMMPPGITTSIDIDAFDALVLFSDSDLSGSRVQSDRPVAVFSGSECSNVGASGSCDELSEQVPPLDYASDEYVICSSVPFRVGDPRDILRVISAAGAMTVTVNGVVAGALAGFGDYMDVTVAGDAHVQTTGPSFVAVHSGEASEDDPAFVLPVGTERYTLGHHVHAMAGWPTHMVQVAAPPGTTVTVDGLPWLGTAWRPVGTSGFSCSEQAIGLAGPHLVEADDDVGVMMYEVGRSAGAWYRTDGDCLLFAVAPDAPLPLAISLAGTTATLTWSAPDDGGCPIQHYEVYRAPTTTGPWALIGTTEKTTFMDTSPVRCQDYAYHVRAVTRAGTSPPSNVVTMFVASPPDPPLLHPPTPRTEGGYAKLVWELPADDGGCPIIEVGFYEGVPGGAATTLGPTVVETWVRPPDPCAPMAYQVDVATRIGRSAPSTEVVSWPLPDLPECTPTVDVPDVEEHVPRSEDSDGDGEPDAADPCPAEVACGGSALPPGRPCRPGPARAPVAAWHVLAPGPRELLLDDDDAWIRWNATACPEGFLVFAEADGPLVAFVPEAPWQAADDIHAAPGRVYWIQPGAPGEAFDAALARAAAPLPALPNDDAPPPYDPPEHTTEGTETLAASSASPGVVLWPWFLAALLVVLIVVLRRRRR